MSRFFGIGKGCRETKGIGWANGVFSLVAHVLAIKQSKCLCNLCICALRC